MIINLNHSGSNKYLLQLVRAVALFLIVFAGACSKRQKPNIIIIYVDDLGYGDVGCYGASNVQTPNVDYLAAKGLKFTDAHCSASTCTPSRFALLTGTYAFRKKAAVLAGDASMLLTPGSETISTVLQKAGYTTAVVGKWHLGLGKGIIDWNDKIIPSPNETGFNYSFIIPATTDRVPTVYVENGKVPGLDSTDPIKVSYANMIGDDPTGLSNPEMLKMKADTQHSNTIVNGISRIGYMSGGKSARWKDEDMADVLTEKAVSFIRRHKDKPFFLYFSIPDIHVPRAPHPRFVGSTDMGKRGDVISEMDWMTGEIVKAINQFGLTNNTLIIFASDNGPVLDDGYADNAVELLGNHDPSGGFRGGKYSAFEAGTRIPTITYWPGTIKPGTSDAVWSQVDLLASLANLTDQQLSPGTGPDSENMLNVLLGKSEKGREYLLEESYTLSLRKGDWKYISPDERSTPAWLKRKRIESGLLPVPQLYNLRSDPGEKNNVAPSYPKIVSELEEKLKMIKGVE